MSTANKTIGKRIRNARKAKDLSIEKMAENLDVSYSTYQRIENGETNSWALHLDSICEILEIPLEEVVLGKEKYIQIVKEQSTATITGEVVVNNLSEKVFELYENRLKDKDAIIEIQKNTIQELKEKIAHIKDVK